MMIPLCYPSMRIWALPNGFRQSLLTGRFFLLHPYEIVNEKGEKYPQEEPEDPGDGEGHLSVRACLSDG